MHPCPMYNIVSYQRLSMLVQLILTPLILLSQMRHTDTRTITPHGPEEPTED